MAEDTTPKLPPDDAPGGDQTAAPVPYVDPNAPGTMPGTGTDVPDVPVDDPTKKKEDEMPGPDAGMPS